MGCGVHDQVGEGAFQGVRPDLDRQVLIDSDPGLDPGPPGALLDISDQLAKVDGLNRLAPFAPGEGQVFVDHVLHF